VVAFAPALSGGVNIPQIAARISYDYFFDRALIKNTLDAAVRRALYKSGSIVFQIARRSIKRQGMALPRLKVMRDNPGISIGQLITRTETTDRRSHRALIKRLRQIQAREPSAPNTPPHTHRGNLRDRPGIVYAFDPTSESVVIGESDPSISWLASLHEFGGSQPMQGWAWVPRYPRYQNAIIGWWRVGQHPQRTSLWEPTAFRERRVYPARPYMRPAIARAIASRDIVKQFQNQFRVGGL